MSANETEHSKEVEASNSTTDAGSKTKQAKKTKGTIRSISKNGNQKKIKKPRRSFPIVTLEDAIKIPEAIRAKNSGNPLESKPAT